MPNRVKKVLLSVTVALCEENGVFYFAYYSIGHRCAFEKDQQVVACFGFHTTKYDFLKSASL